MGYELLHDPRLNKGTAFTEAERHTRARRLLPPAVTTIELQIARRHAEIASLDDDLQKYLVLSDLQARNETLFYAVLMSDPATYMPLVYTPTVGEACQKFAHIFRSPRGMYLPISARGRIERDSRQLAGKGRALHRRHRRRAHSGSGRSRRRRHGHSDRQTRALHRLRRRAAAILPADRARCRHEQPGAARRPAVSRSAAERACAARNTWRSSTSSSRRCRRFTRNAASSGRTSPTSTRCRFWRAIATGSAPINDDIQGTAASRWPASSPRLRITGRKLTDQRFLFLGGGSAGDRHRRADQPGHGAGRHGLQRGAGPQRAVRHQWPAGDLAHRPAPTSRSRSRWIMRRSRHFVDAVRALRPTGIIGVSTVPKLFNREVIEAMAEINERPIIFPYSNPTSRSECTAEEAYRWSEGRAMFASGSPFPPVEIDGRHFVPGQGNNVYIFPAMGMAVFATEAKRVTEEMFIVAAQGRRRAGQRGGPRTGLIYPPQSRDPRGIAACRRADRHLHLRPGPGTRSTAGRCRRADPRPRLPSDVHGVKP